jgi:alkylresorcinol/alkylpyrone synthase
MIKAATSIERAWTQFPDNRYCQDELIDRLPAWLPPKKLGLGQQVFRRARVASRHMVVGPDEALVAGRSFASKNAVYQRAIRTETKRICDKILADVPRAELADVDLLITASCTGFQIPAMDSLIIQALGLPLNLRRLNLTEHGCAAGAAALGMAHEWLTSRKNKRALVVASEFCSLTFQPEDTSDENIISAAIFGDGSAAVLLAGSEAPRGTNAPARFRIRDTFREFFPKTEHFMGFEVNDLGFKIKLSREVVEFSKGQLPEVFARACHQWEIASAQVFETGSLHPGGRRILEILEEEVGVSSAVTRTSWECLERYGNMSSVSVLAALHRLLSTEGELRPGALGLITAFGPGFGAELSLLDTIPLPAAA